MWIDGYDNGNHRWLTRGFREWDSNQDPTDIKDLSVERSWFRESIDDENELFKPKRVPASLTSIPSNFCSNDSASNLKLYMIGKWNPLSMSSKIPRIKVVINKTTDLFNWAFIIGNKKIPHKYETWSRTNKINNTVVVTNLLDLDWDLQKFSEFNLSISCKNYPVFETKLNFWDPGNDPNGIKRESTSWDSTTSVDGSVDPSSIKEIILDGGIGIDYVGITGDGCLSLTSNGLIVPSYGSTCTTAQDAVCEHQSCYTHHGDECIFPFPYKGITYYNCTSIDVYKPWCATG